MTDFISSISNATNQVIQTKQRGEALQEQQRNNLDQQSARISAQGSQMLSDIDNLSNFLKGEAAWDSQVRAARTGMVQFSKDFSHAADLDEYNGPAARLIASQQIKTLYNPALPNISPQERANRGLILQEDPRLRVVMASIDREVKQLPAVQIGDRRVALSEYQTLLTSPGLDGDRARRHLENADESLQMQLLASPELNGKLSAVRHPGTGKIQLVTPDELVEYRAIAGAKINMAAEFTQNFGRAPAEAPEEFARFTQQKQTELSERMDLTELARDARERRADLFHGKYKTMPAQTSLGETREVPIGPAPMDAYAQVEEAKVVAVLDPIKDFTREQKLAIDAEVLGLGEASVAFHRTYTRLTKGGMKDTDAAMAALTEARAAKDLFNEWEKSKSINPNSASIALKPLFHRGMSVDEIRPRAQWVTAAANDPMEASRRINVINAEQQAYKGETLSEAEEQSRMQKIQWATQVSSRVPEIPLERLVGPGVTSGELQDAAGLLQGWSGEYVSPDLFNMVAGLTPGGDLRGVIANLAVADASADLTEYSRALVSGSEAQKRALGQELQTALHVSQVMLASPRQYGGAVSAIAQAASTGSLTRQTDEVRKLSSEGEMTQNTTVKSGGGTGGLDVGGAPVTVENIQSKIPIGKTTTETVSRFLREYPPVAEVTDANVDKAWQGVLPYLQQLQKADADTDMIYTSVDILFSEAIRGAKTPEDRARVSTVIGKLREKVDAQRRIFAQVESLDREIARVGDLDASEGAEVEYSIPARSILFDADTTTGKRFSADIQTVGTLNSGTDTWEVRAKSREDVLQFLEGLRGDTARQARSFGTGTPFKLPETSGTGSASKLVLQESTSEILTMGPVFFDQTMEYRVRDTKPWRPGDPREPMDYPAGRIKGPLETRRGIEMRRAEPSEYFLEDLWDRVTSRGRGESDEYMAKVREVESAGDPTALLPIHADAFNRLVRLRDSVKEGIHAVKPGRGGADEVTLFYDKDYGIMDDPAFGSLVFTFGKDTPLTTLKLEGGFTGGRSHMDMETAQALYAGLDATVLKVLHKMPGIAEATQKVAQE
jgi:hypothetical protein